MHTFTVSVYGVGTSIGIMCVKCTFAPCLQMDDASIWSSGRWEPVQRAETQDWDWDWMSSSLLCLFTFPLPSWGGYAALSEDMWKRREKRREKNSGGGRQKWVTAAVTSLTAGWKWVVESRGGTKKKTGLSWSSLIHNLVCFIIFGGKGAKSSCPHLWIGPFISVGSWFWNWLNYFSWASIGFIYFICFSCVTSKY